MFRIFIASNYCSMLLSILAQEEVNSTHNHNSQRESTKFDTAMYRGGDSYMGGGTFFIIHVLGINPE